MIKKNKDLSCEFCGERMHVKIILGFDKFDLCKPCYKKNKDLDLNELQQERGV